MPTSRTTPPTDPTKAMRQHYNTNVRVRTCRTRDTTLGRALNFLKKKGECALMAKPSPAPESSNQKSQCSSFTLHSTLEVDSRPSPGVRLKVELRKSDNVVKPPTPDWSLCQSPALHPPLFDTAKRGTKCGGELRTRSRPGLKAHL